MATLIELCAGSAAVSLRWLGQRPPFGTSGGKSGHSARILAAMGLCPGGASSSDEVVLCEPGMWGEAWGLWAGDPDTLRQTAARLEPWCGHDPRELWQALAKGPIPSHPVARVAAWMVLQYWGYGRKPVYPQGGRWRHHGFNAGDAYRRERAAEKREEGLPASDGPSRRLPELVEWLRAADLSRVSRVYRSIAEVPIAPGARTYLDPPYVSTTCCFEHQLPRQEVLRIAQERAAGGERVFVSEAEPLPLSGWRHLDLGAPRGRGRTFSRQQREVLTLSQAGP